MITLYTAATPNGHKISIMLEELGMPYEMQVLELGKQQQKEPAYLKLNPNGRIPTIVDHDNGDFAVFESGAILIYLAEKTGKLLPSEVKARSQVLQWLMFQMGGVGPMMGQANVFFRYFPEKIQPAIDRYQNEVKRLFGVLDRQLENHEFLAGAYSIADIATFPWVHTHAWSGVALDDFPHLSRWREQIQARPAVQRGMERPASTLKLGADTAESRRAEEHFVGNARKLLQTGGAAAAKGE